MRHRLGVDLVRKAETRTEVSPVDIGTIISGATGAIAELAWPRRQVAGGRVLRRGIEEHDQLLFSVKGTWISHRKPTLSVNFGRQLDVVLDVGREARLRSRSS